MCIVLASDGVWEFIDNVKAWGIIAPYYKKNDAEGACKMLIREATKIWKREDEVIDDITTIVLFFNNIINDLQTI